MAERIAEKVLLIGWDAADWKVINPLMDAGKMPALQSLVERGVMGNIATLDPPFSPMLWTSIATGHTADKHGILHFTQPTADGTRAKPILGSTRKVKALWNILSQSGMKSNVVAWWPSHPVDKIDGVMVSNFFHRATKPVHEEWTVAPGAVHPERFEELLASLRVHPAELTATHLQPFIPRISEIDPMEDKRGTSASKILADATTIHAVTTWLMDNTEWDLTAVYLDAIDHFGHGFMKYHPPRMDHVSEHDFDLYKNVVTAGYQFHDMMLGTLLNSIDDRTAVVLVSDHGFHSDHLRPTSIPSIPAGPAIEHRDFGILCMAGPGIKSDERIYGAGLLNIAPTILAMLGLSVGEDMAGRPLLQAFEEPPVISFLESWEEVEGEDGMQLRSEVDPWAEREAIRQLVELGYIDEEENDARSGAEGATISSRFNLARVYLSTSRTEEAIPHLEFVFASNDKYKAHYGLWLANAYKEVGQYDKARSVLDDIAQLEPSFGKPIRLMQIDISLEQGQHEQGLKELQSLDASELQNPEILIRVGLAHLILGNHEDSLAAYQAVLDKDADNARAWHGLAKNYIKLKDYEKAAEAALSSVSRLYHYPQAHFHLGVALTHLGWIDRALDAFKVCLTQNPDFALAHRWLAKLYHGYLKQPREAAHHLELYKANRLR